MDWGGVALLHIVHVTVKAYNVECVETKVKFCGVRGVRRAAAGCGDTGVYGLIYCNV